MAELNFYAVLLLWAFELKFKKSFSTSFKFGKFCFVVVSVIVRIKISVYRYFFLFTYILPLYVIILACIHSFKVMVFHNFCVFILSVIFSNTPEQRMMMVMMLMLFLFLFFFSINSITYLHTYLVEGLVSF